MKAADYIAAELERRGVTHVFELVGGMITFLLDALARRGGVAIVSMHHEQGAGFAAEGLARMRGQPGVAMATSGPGATNLLTAIGSCYFDSTPAVFITGQVNRHEQKGTRAVRQLGFQETDIVSMARPVTKAAWLVEDVADLPRLLDEAFRLAAAGRPGPVLIDIPMDVQRAEVVTPMRIATDRDSAPTAPAMLSGFLDELVHAVGFARRPLVLVGGGVRAARCIELTRATLARLGVPVVYSLLGVDTLPASDPLRVGLIGSYGNRWANLAVAESDMILVLGSRLDVRQTGADVTSFIGERRIFHVDCEAGELNNRVKGCTTLVCELPAFLSALLAQPLLPVANSLSVWRSRIEELRAASPDTGELPGLSGINPNVFMRALSAASSAAAAYVVDVGQHQMWAAQSLQPGPAQRFLTSGGMGAMGFALPAAIGACLGASSRPVVVIAGDGGFQLNLQELQTVVRNALPLKIVVLNNGCHGMVRQFQESYFKGRYQSTVDGYSAPDFAALAGAYGLAGRRVTAAMDVAAALSWLWNQPHDPALLEVMIESGANAYPKLAFGRPISEMEPQAKPVEMEGT